MTAIYRSALAGLTMLGIFGFADSASAVTVNAYSFTQGGYQSPIGGDTATLSGSFSGIVDSTGHIELADLGSFSVQIHIQTSTYTSTDGPTFFSFNTTGGASTLDFIVKSPLPIFTSNLCVGAAASLGAAGCGAGGGYVGIFFTLGPIVTSDFPEITLTSSITKTPVTTPLPASLVLFASGLVGLAGLRFHKRASAFH